MKLSLQNTKHTIPLLLIFLLVLVGVVIWTSQDLAWKTYTSADKNFNFSYPAKIFKYPSTPVILGDGAAYSQFWTNKPLVRNKSIANGYGLYGNDFLKLSSIHVGTTNNQTDFNRYYDAAENAELLKTDYQSDYKVMNVDNNGIVGYVYTSAYSQDVSVYTLTAVWPTDGGVGKFQLELLSSSQQELDKNKDLFLKIVRSVKITQ